MVLGLSFPFGSQELAADIRDRVFGAWIFTYVDFRKFIVQILSF